VSLSTCQFTRSALSLIAIINVHAGMGVPSRLGGHQRAMLVDTATPRPVGHLLLADGAVERSDFVNAVHDLPSHLFVDTWMSARLAGDGVVAEAIESGHADGVAAVGFFADGELKGGVAGGGRGAAHLDQFLIGDLAEVDHLGAFPCGIGTPYLRVGTPVNTESQAVTLAIYLTKVTAVAVLSAAVLIPVAVVAAVMDRWLMAHA